MRWEEYMVKGMASALVITGLFSLWMLWQLADVSVPPLTNSAVAQDTTSTALETTGETTNESSVLQNSTAQQTTTQQETTRQRTTRQQTTPARTTRENTNRLKNSGGASGGASARAVPLMPGGRCPSEFPVKRQGACHVSR